MKFKYVIGNPPYQDDSTGEQKTFYAPIYHYFMDGAFKVGEKVELIHPARFLFNAGGTPSKWNKKMLEDEHFKVLEYEAKSDKIFPNKEIKGGIAITYRDSKKNFGAINVFSAYKELNAMMKKVTTDANFKSLSTIVITRTAYRLTNKMHADYPNAIKQLSKGHAYDMSTNIFDRLPEIFFEARPVDGNEYIGILGRIGNERVKRYVRRDYVNKVSNLEGWKVILPKTNGSGALGEVLATPLIGEPLIGNTESFISIGNLDSRDKAEALMKYIKSKFARCMLGILKVTQDNPPAKWKFVPLQDFTASSDIDWSKPIPEIDRQLYKKYGLSPAEIDFIESHVKEMA